MVVLLQLEPPGVAPGCGPAAPLAEEVPSTRSSPSLREQGSNSPATGSLRRSRPPGAPGAVE